MKYLIFLYFFISTSIFAQQKGTILDSLTHEPIAYGGIWSNRMGSNASADRLGNFITPEIRTPDTLIFFVPGYKLKKLTLGDFGSDVLLVPNINNTVYQLKGENENQIIDDGITNNLNMVSITDTPRLLARFIAYDSSFQATPFLKNIRFSYLNKAPDAIFKVRFFEAGADGKPSNELTRQTILYKALVTYLPSDDPESDQFNKVDERLELTDFPVAFPKNGLFIAIESLNLEQNALWLGPNKMTGPIFASKKGNKGLWEYEKGKWKQDLSSDVFKIQLTLTD